MTHTLLCYIEYFYIDLGEGGSVALAGNIWLLESGRSQIHKKGGIY